MIRNKADLMTYLHADKSRYIYSSRPLWFRLFVTSDEEAKAILFLKVLRHLEYHINISGNPTGGIYGLFLWFVYRRLRSRYKIYIEPNTVGPGLRIYHFAGGIYLNIERMGAHCSVSTGVVCGNKNDDNQLRPTIGNNVQLATGAKVIGKVTVGDNSFVAPNSVVVKDVESNAVVSGVPARLIKFRNAE